MEDGGGGDTQRKGRRRGEVGKRRRRNAGTQMRAPPSDCALYNGWGRIGRVMIVYRGTALCWVLRPGGPNQWEKQTGGKKKRENTTIRIWGHNLVCLQLVQYPTRIYGRDGESQEMTEVRRRARERRLATHRFTVARQRSHAASKGATKRRFQRNGRV